MSDSFDEIVDEDWDEGVPGLIDEFVAPPFYDQRSFRPEELADRAKRGVAVSDLWNNGYIYWLYAEMLREKGTPEAGVLLDCLIELNEYGEARTVPFYVNSDTFLEAIKEHNKVYGEKFEEAKIIWPKIYKEAVSPDFFLSEIEVKKILLALKRDATKPWVWDDVKDVIPDPTEVFPENEEEHRTQRSMRGYSDWDKLIFPTYVHWVFMTAALFHGSDKAMSYPSLYHNNLNGWVLALQVFIEGLMYGTFLETLTPSQATIYDIAIGNMLDYIPDFWD